MTKGQDRSKANKSLLNKSILQRGRSSLSRENSPSLWAFFFYKFLMYPPEWVWGLFFFLGFVFSWGLFFFPGCGGGGGAFHSQPVFSTSPWVIFSQWLQDFLLSLASNSLTMMYPSVYLFLFIVLGVCWASGFED